MGKISAKESWLNITPDNILNGILIHQKLTIALNIVQIFLLILRVDVLPGMISTSLYKVEMGILSLNIGNIIMSFFIYKKLKLFISLLFEIFYIVTFLYTKNLNSSYTISSPIQLSYFNVFVEKDNSSITNLNTTPFDTRLLIIVIVSLLLIGFRISFFLYTNYNLRMFTFLIHMVFCISLSAVVLLHILFIHIYKYTDINAIQTIKSSIKRYQAIKDQSNNNTGYLENFHKLLIGIYTKSTNLRYIKLTDNVINIEYGFPYYFNSKLCDKKFKYVCLVDLSDNDINNINPNSDNKIDQDDIIYNDVLNRNKHGNTSSMYRFYNRKNFIHLTYSDTSLYFEIIILNQRPFYSNFSLLIFFMFSVLMVIFFYRRVYQIISEQFSKPLYSLSNWVSQIKENPFSIVEESDNTITVDPSEVITQLAEKYNDKFPEITILRYKTNRLAQLLIQAYGFGGKRILLESLKSDRIKIDTSGRVIEGVFVFFIINRFKELSEHSGVHINKLVNDLARVIHPEIVKMGGIVNRTLGREIMCYWDLNNNELDFDIIIEGLIYILKEVESKYSKLFNELLMSNKLNRIIDKEDDKESGVNDSNNNLSLLSVGVHKGWAFEGAIGSKEKLDFTFLSENVNISARVASINTFYQTNILYTDTIYERLSSNLKEHSLAIDNVYLKGSLKAQRLYTILSNTDINSTPDPEISILNDAFNTYQKGDIEEAKNKYKKVNIKRKSSKIIKERVEMLEEGEDVGPYRLDIKH